MLLSVPVWSNYKVISSKSHFPGLSNMSMYSSDILLTGEQSSTVEGPLFLSPGHQINRSLSFIKMNTFPSLTQQSARVCWRAIGFYVRSHHLCNNSETIYPITSVFELFDWIYQELLIAPNWRLDSEWPLNCSHVKASCPPDPTPQSSHAHKIAQSNLSTQIMKQTAS